MIDASWIQRVADTVDHRFQNSLDRELVCASGISPSGPIHLGNLREVMTAHFVAEELRHRGLLVIHRHSWDDYDRFRKVPAGLDESLAEHIGRPLSAVPDPFGSSDSYASHFINEFSAALSLLGVRMDEVRQSVRYPRGDYNASIRRAVERRGEIFEILAESQTESLHERSREERRTDYYPFRPYCESCGRDTTIVSSYDDLWITYSCRCSYQGGIWLADASSISGKLAWKVDWPMRWIHERVSLEPAGEDHHAPGSSYASGSKIAVSIFEGTPPLSFAYAFVGISGGSGKMSGSAGGAAIPLTALDVLEPAIVRWLYARRSPSQAFSIDLSPRAVQRLYDEWDQFLDRSADPSASQSDIHLRNVCLSTSVGSVMASKRRVPFRLLASAADITQANREQIARIVGLHLGPDQTVADEEALEPRLSCSVNFATALVPPEERTTIRTEFDSQAWTVFDERTRAGVRLAAEQLESSWTLDGLTRLLYGVPKVLLGLPEDTKPTPDLKVAQRAFFVALYRLLCGSDTGPRLPTLLLSIGPEQSRRLLVEPRASLETQRPVGPGSTSAVAVERGAGTG